ncbi:MAG: FmdE family protein [Bacteroidota bacterium]
MKKKLLIVLLLATGITLWASPLHSRLKHSIIIDTDCNDSDLRAIGILLSHPGIAIKAILVSDGKLQSEEGLKKIGSLLQQFKADTIPVGSKTEISAKVSLAEILEASEEQMTIVCLGPLTNIALELKNNKGLYKNIEELIWYNESPDPLHGYNDEYDKNAVDFLFNSGIDMDVISGLNNDFEKAGQREELSAIYLANPELFEMSPLDEYKTVNVNKNQNIPAIREVISDMNTGNYKPGHFAALYGFPVHRELYAYDVRQIMGSAISRYGMDEWKACVITDEFHGHLGVFSIVGAKMGIYARDYFGIGPDLLEIHTYAGLKEPFSCMNDGLQVSTGATLGQNSIHVANDTIAKPQAVFTYRDRSVRISLKPEFLEELKSVIDQGIKNHGLEDEAYWTLIRQTSIKYWLEWNREEIFDMEIL